MRFLTLLLVTLVLTGCNCGAQTTESVWEFRNPFRTAEKPLIQPTGYGIYQQQAPALYGVQQIPYAAPQQYGTPCSPMVPGQLPAAPVYQWAAPTPASQAQCVEQPAK